MLRAPGRAVPPGPVVSRLWSGSMNLVRLAPILALATLNLVVPVLVAGFLLEVR